MNFAFYPCERFWVPRHISRPFPASSILKFDSFFPVVPSLPLSSCPSCLDGRHTVGTMHANPCASGTTCPSAVLGRLTLSFALPSPSLVPYFHDSLTLLTRRSRLTRTHDASHHGFVELREEAMTVRGISPNGVRGPRAVEGAVRGKRRRMLTILIPPLLSFMGNPTLRHRVFESSADREC